MKGPETYLAARGIALTSYFDAKQPAVLDARLRSQVNYEFYFFADGDERARFEKDPVRHCGLVTDTVSRVRFGPTPKSPRAEHGGHAFFFVSPENLRTFTATPDSFAVPRVRMLPSGMEHETPK